MDCYPPAVQEYLAAFPPHEVPRVVNRLLLWAVRCQRALAAGDPAQPALPAAPECLPAGLPSGTKRPCSAAGKQRARPASETRLQKPHVFGEYPSWWGHEEHKPNSHPRGRTVPPECQTTGGAVEWNGMPYCAPQGTVDEATQTLDPAAFVRPPPKPDRALNEGSVQASHSADPADAEGPEEVVSGERQLTPRRSEVQESTRAGHARHPRPQRRPPSRRAVSDSAAAARNHSTKPKKPSPKKPSVAWMVSAAATPEPAYDADESGEGTGREDEPRPLAQYTDIWHAADSTRIPGVLRRRPSRRRGSGGKDGTQNGPAAIVMAFLASSFVQCLDEPEITEKSDLSSLV